MNVGAPGFLPHQLASASRAVRTYRTSDPVASTPQDEAHVSLRVFQSALYRQTIETHTRHQPHQPVAWLHPSSSHATERAVGSSSAGSEYQVARAAHALSPRDSADRCSHPRRAWTARALAWKAKPSLPLTWVHRRVYRFPSGKSGYTGAGECLDDSAHALDD